MVFKQIHPADHYPRRTTKANKDFAKKTTTAT